MPVDFDVQSSWFFSPFPREKFMKIACLHTAESNIAVFEEAGLTLGIPYGVLTHEVRADLLSAAELAGGLTSCIEGEVRSALIALSLCADAVLLTCSTLGPAVVAAGKATAVPILRVDEALAEKTIEVGGKIVVLCAVETTLQPTMRIFADAAIGANVSVEVRLVSGAWALFKAGDLEGYLSAIAKSADAAYVEGNSMVALAQASMAGAAKRVKNGPEPMCSPIAGLTRALEALSKRF